MSEAKADMFKTLPWFVIFILQPHHIHVVAID